MLNTANTLQVQQYLENIEYPCDKGEIINVARNEGADEEVIHLLTKLPEGVYHSPADVSESLNMLQ